ncbi:hypothetical protein GCM10025795_38130 [Verticiella sediminum]
MPDYPETGSHIVSSSSFIGGRRAARLACVALAAATLAACGAVDRTGRAFWQPYRPNIQQGNWVTSQQIAQLRPGMTREQVRYVLGTPTLTPLFHADRWEYPYFLKPGYGQVQERHFTVYFDGDILARWDGDPQPNLQPFQQPREGEQAFSPLPEPGAVVGSIDGLGAGAVVPPPAEREDTETQQAEQPQAVRNPMLQLQKAPVASPSSVPSAGGSGGTVPLR